MLAGFGMWVPVAGTPPAELPLVEVGTRERPTQTSVRGCPEGGEPFAVASQAAVGTVSPDHAGQVQELIPERHVPMLPAPVPNRLGGPRETRPGVV